MYHNHHFVSLLRVSPRQFCRGWLWSGLVIVVSIVTNLQTCFITLHSARAGRGGTIKEEELSPS